MTNLSREEFLTVARGDDPVRRPLWNGFPQITTPDQFPKRPMPYEGQLFQFLLPYPIHVFDDNIWPALHIKRADLELLLLKPVSQHVTPREEVTSGNETPDVFVTTFPAIVESTSPFYPLSHRVAFTVVHQATRWIRVLTRQYWVGSGTAGVSAQYRGSAFRVEGSEVFQRNYAHYGQAALVRSLKKSTWEALVHPVEEQTPVPVAESLFCDSLTSFAVGDTVLALVQLGVACEIAITNILDDLAAAGPSTQAAKDYLKARHKGSDRFGSKLTKDSVSLGMSNPRDFHPVGKPSDWVDLILLLYGFRNKAAHEGKALVKDRKTGVLRPLKTGELQSFMFATEALFPWIAEQRKTQIGNSIMPISPDGQIIGIVGNVQQEGGFGLDTGESHSTGGHS